MKAIRFIPPAIVLFVCLVSSCNTEPISDKEEFLVIDRTSGRAISLYEYAPGKDQMSKAVSYDASSRAIRSTSFEYDASGRATRMATTTPTLDSTQTRVTNFVNQTDRDTEGRITKTIQTAGDGTVTETYYGYDQSGVLRGVVQKDADGTLTMMDY